MLRPYGGRVPDEGGEELLERRRWDDRAAAGSGFGRLFACGGGDGRRSFRDVRFGRETVDEER